MWYQKLPTGSIDFYDTIIEKFNGHSTAKKKLAKNTLELFSITQVPNESLQSYLSRARQEHLNITALDLPMALTALKASLQEGPFQDNVEWKIFKNMDDVKDRAEAYMATEDFKTVVTKRF